MATEKSSMASKMANKAENTTYLRETLEHITTEDSFVDLSYLQHYIACPMAITVLYHLS